MFDNVITRCENAEVFELVGPPTTNKKYHALATTGYRSVPEFYASSVVTVVSHHGEVLYTLNDDVIPSETYTALQPRLQPVSPNEYRWHHIAYKAGLDPKDGYMPAAIIDRLLERKAITGQQVVDALIWVEKRISGEIEF